MKTLNFNSPTILIQAVLGASDQHQLLVSDTLSADADHMQQFFPSF